jgi:aspartyl-tRNA(Asn)/glutamyl-tRNA(Gln) amidotransferase subunit A
MANDPCQLTAADLAAAYRAGTLSPVDTVEALLARIAIRDPHLQSFVEVYAKDARLAAEAADKAIRSGHDLGPLHGVPVALKDLIDVEGRQTMGGSRAYRGRRSTVTATLARKLIGAGAILLGKTHTVEFAFGGWGTNTHLGTPRNPWQPAAHFTPGGSSSGSGVAVAARLVPLAVGTDTGGSVRIPASFNGITGLKVTRGRISNFGIIPLSVSLDSPGPMARTVEDAALMYAAMAGPDSRDPMSLGLPPDDPMTGLWRGVRGLCLGRVSRAQCGGTIDAETEAAYEAALETLSRLGAEILPLDLPHSLLGYAAMSEISAAEAYAQYSELADDPDAEIGPHTRARLLAGRISARDYLTQQWRRPALTAEFLAALGSADLLLAPTTRHPAIPKEDVDETVSPVQMTRFVNILGLCALAMPNGMTASGLPTSLQIIGRPLAESMVLRVGWAFEQAGEWHRMAPPDHTSWSVPA